MLALLPSLALAAGALLSPPPVAGFLDVEIAPAALPSLAPSRSDPSVDDALAMLAITNPTSSWAEVTISGVAVGVLGPRAEGALHGVAQGDYTVSLRLMNGFSQTRTVSTGELLGATPAVRSSQSTPTSEPEFQTWRDDDPLLDLEALPDGPTINVERSPWEAGEEEAPAPEAPAAGEPARESSSELGPSEESPAPEEPTLEVSPHDVPGVWGAEAPSAGDEAGAGEEESEPTPEQD